MAEWYSKSHDIDVFVDDGSKKAPKFDPRRKLIAYWPGDVRTEFKTGPGHELWLMRDTPPGKYTIYLNLYDRKGNPSPGRVTPFVVFGSEIFAMPDMKLPQEKKAVAVGTLTMTEDRNLSFQGATPEIHRRFLEQQKERNRKNLRRDGFHPLGALSRGTERKEGTWQTCSSALKDISLIHRGTPPVPGAGLGLTRIAPGVGARTRPRTFTAVLAQLHRLLSPIRARVGGLEQQPGASYRLPTSPRDLILL